MTKTEQIFTKIYWTSQWRGFFVLQGENIKLMKNENIIYRSNSMNIMGLLERIHGKPNNDRFCIDANRL